METRPMSTQRSSGDMMANTEGAVTTEATSSWKLVLTLTNVYGSFLYQFFDPSDQDDVARVLDTIVIEDLTITYTYQGTNTSYFDVVGTIRLGSLPLDLSWTYDSGSWSFSAFLSLDQSNGGQTTTLGGLAQDLFGPDIANDLPAFVSDVVIETPSQQDTVGLAMSRVKDSEAEETGETKGLLLAVWVTYDGFDFQAVQFQPAADGEDTPPVQRAFVLSFSAMPTADIPLIGKIPQPFDEMLFMYVQDSAEAASGMTYSGVANINSGLSVLNSLLQPLQYRVTKKDSDYQPADVVILPGLHFMLIKKDSTGTTSVTLDYVFGHKSESVRSLQAQDADEPDPGAQKAAYEKTLGPLTIRNMGLKYSGGDTPTLAIQLDASIVLGPIGVDLLGFELGLCFTAGFTLHNLPTPTAAIQGLEILFDQSPILLEGMFMGYDNTYQGGVVLSLQPWTFNAVGFYGQGSPPGDWTSVFVYFMLDGPLATLGFAEIRGVTGGFGYNSFLKFPSVTDVASYPLITPPTPTDPQQALGQLVTTGWFFEQQGSFWLAAGLAVLAFGVLQVQVVIAIEWDPKIRMSLFGLATADVPSGEDAFKFAHVQLGLVAVLDFDAGTLQIQGQLSPNSYVLDPSCHLTGGFALYSWFGASALAGDFVFTIGGYHRSYQPPSQYPSSIPRLGISWSFDSSISITGEAYFAITPQLCMAGGRLDVSLTLGPLFAYLDAYADFLINYKPFYFTASIGISVGVGFTLDLWICTIQISIDLSATLDLYGPPFAGHVHVNFWVFGFDIDFGDTSSSAPKLTLDEFYQETLQSSLAASLASKTPSLTSSDAAPHIFTCNQGLIPSSKQDASSTPNTGPWKVRGAVFQFTVGCKFAIQDATVITADLEDQPLNVPSTNQSIYAKPMQLTEALTSTLTITITPQSSLTNRSDDPLIPRWDTASLTYKPVPKALWEKYSSDVDPTTSPRSPSLLKPTETSITLAMGIQISSPTPVLSIDDTLPKFKYEVFFVEDVSDTPSPFPDIIPADAAWYPEPLDPSVDEWESVRQQWDGKPGLGRGAAEEAVALWAGLSFTGWDLTGGTNANGDVQGVMTGKKPEKLLDEDVFPSLFLEAPRVGSMSG